MMILDAEKPIGIFDSGVGGISIWKEVHKALPNEQTIYLSDSINAPYGQKSKERITELSIKNTEYLLERNCKLIIVACNTATTNAIKHLRNSYNIPFIGIEPAIKPASLQTKTKTVGILATKGTLNSELFEKTSSKIGDNINIIEQVGEGLVELIEAGKIDSEEMYLLLEKYLKPMLDQNIDCLVLGCTHYPFLIPTIKKITNNSINIIDSGEAVARQTKRILSQENLLNTTSSQINPNIFYTNSDKRLLQTLVKDFKNVIVERKEF